MAKFVIQSSTEYDLKVGLSEKTGKDSLKLKNLEFVLDQRRPQENRTIPTITKNKEYRVTGSIVPLDAFELMAVCTTYPKLTFSLQVGV